MMEQFAAYGPGLAALAGTALFQLVPGPIAALCKSRAGPAYPTVKAVVSGA